MIRAALLKLLTLFLAGCMVGPDFVPPEQDAPPGWVEPPAEGLSNLSVPLETWWQIFEDPVLDELIQEAFVANNTLELAGLRVLEARAQLGIATGAQYPQSQVLVGDGTYVSPPDNTGITSGDWSYFLGASAAWELDFFGRYRRGVEAADALIPGIGGQLPPGHGDSCINGGSGVHSGAHRPGAVAHCARERDAAAAQLRDCGRAVS